MPARLPVDGRQAHGGLPVEVTLTPAALLCVPFPRFLALADLLIHFSLSLSDLFGGVDTTFVVGVHGPPSGGLGQPHADDRGEFVKISGGRFTPPHRAGRWDAENRGHSGPRGNGARCPHVLGLFIRTSSSAGESHISVGSTPAIRAVAIHDPPWDRHTPH